MQYQVTSPHSAQDWLDYYQLRYQVLREPWGNRRVQSRMNWKPAAPIAWCGLLTVSCWLSAACIN